MADQTGQVAENPGIPLSIPVSECPHFVQGYLAYNIRVNIFNIQHIIGALTYIFYQIDL